MTDGEDGVRQVAHTLQSCLELTEPVQQIQLVKKVKHFFLMVILENVWMLLDFSP